MGALTLQGCAREVVGAAPTFDAAEPVELSEAAQEMLEHPAEAVEAEDADVAEAELKEDQPET